MGATTDHEFAAPSPGKATHPGIVLQHVDCLNDFTDSICRIGDIKRAKVVNDPIKVLLRLRRQFDSRHSQRSGVLG